MDQNHLMAVRDRYKYCLRGNDAVWGLGMPTEPLAEVLTRTEAQNGLFHGSGVRPAVHRGR